MKMFINRPTIKTIVAAFAAALIIPSCAQLEETQGQGVGYLTISGLDVDVTVDMIMPTKSVSLPEISDPTDIICKVTDKNGNEYRSDSDSWKSPLVIPVGSYTLEAWSGENGFGAPYFYGKTTGTIGAENKTETVTLSVANSLVAVTVSSDLDGHFKPGSNVTLTSGSVSYTASLGSYCFVPSGAALTLSLAGTNSAANPAEFTYTLSSPAAKTAYEVICGKSSTNWPGISISSDLNEGAFEGGLYFAAASVSGAMSDENKADLVYQIKGGSYSDWTTITPSEVSGYKYISGLANGTTYTLRACVGNITSAEYTFTPVTFASCVTVSSSAAHTTNTAGELDGTAVSTTVTTNLPSIVAEIATTTATGTFATSDNVTRSSAASTALNENGTTSLTMTNADGWPYIPQGSGYEMTLNATCKVGDKTYTAAVTSDVTVPAPSFTVTAYAETTYSRYLNYKNGVSGYTLDLANAEGTAEKVMDIHATIGISNDLITNSNYSSLLGDATLTYDGLSMLTSPVVTTNQFVPNTLASSTAIDGNKGLLDGDDVINQAWGSHVIAASFTFDGATASSSLPCHITGLPYEKDFTSNSDSNGWSFVNRTEYNKDYSQDYKSGCGYLLYYAYTNDKGCHAFSPVFYPPESVDVTYKSVIYAGTTLHNDKSYTIYTGITTENNVVQTYSGSITEKTYCSTDGYNSLTLTNSGTIANLNRICVTHNADLTWGQGSEHYIYLGYLEVKYR